MRASGFEFVSERIEFGRRVVHGERSSASKKGRFERDMASKMFPG
jgi:hypothetical protein